MRSEHSRDLFATTRTRNAFAAIRQPSWPLDGAVNSARGRLARGNLNRLEMVFNQVIWRASGSRRLYCGVGKLTEFRGERD